MASRSLLQLVSSTGKQSHAGQSYSGVPVQVSRGHAAQRRESREVSGGANTRAGLGGLEEIPGKGGGCAKVQLARPEGLVLDNDSGRCESLEPM